MHKHIWGSLGHHAAGRGDSGPVTMVAAVAEAAVGGGNGDSPERKDGFCLEAVMGPR